MSVGHAACCINPDCPRPHPQPWGNKFCQSCGASLVLQNRYIPLEQLGSGGFATIYTIWDLDAEIERVLKVLVETSPKALELFHQEAAVLKHLRHPGVPQVGRNGFFKVSLTTPQPRILPCLVMEKIHGETLQDILDRYPQGCPEASVLNWLNQSLEILGELHSRKIIHRDIKPSNLMIRQDSGQLVTIDFGGAKQIGVIQQSSTRLISPGYSPPEQIMGSGITPASDFYALGRTIIHLITGKYPGDLENPTTGELNWRLYASVSPAVADVIDDMVQADIQRRPINAAQIQRRLAAISTLKTTLTQRHKPFYSEITRKGIAGINRLLTRIVEIAVFILQIILKVVLACVDTVLEMLLGGLGAAIGTVLGLTIAYGLGLSPILIDLLADALSNLLEQTINLEPQIIVFGVAGVGTALGLTLAGGFGQQRRFRVAGIIGFIGYSLSWFIWQVMPSVDALESWGALITIAVTFLTLGLGLKKHYLLHAIVATSGTAFVILRLMALEILPREILVDVFLLSPVSSWFGFTSAIAFFAFLGINTGFWLGISYYILVPILRGLGWR